MAFSSPLNPYAGSDWVTTDATLRTLTVTPGKRYWPVVVVTCNAQHLCSLWIQLEPRLSLPSFAVAFPSHPAAKRRSEINRINIRQLCLLFFLLSIQNRILDKQTKQNTWPEPNPGSKQTWIRHLWLGSVILNPVKYICLRSVRYYDIWTPNHLVGWVMAFGIFQDAAQGYDCILGSGTPQLCLRPRTTEQRRGRFTQVGFTRAVQLSGSEHLCDPVP